MDLKRELNTSIDVSTMHDKISASGSFPHPQSLSRREREEKPFALRDKGTLEAEQKGGDEGGVCHDLRNHR